MLCFLCCFSSARQLCFCRRGRPIRVVSTSDMTIVNICDEKAVCDCITVKPLPVRFPRRSHSEPPACTERILAFVRFRSLRERRERRKPPVCQASFVSIPSSYDARRSMRRKRRRVAKKRMERELSTTSLSSSSSDPVLTTKSPSIVAAEMNNNEHLTLDTLEPQSVDFEDIEKFKSPSYQAVLVNNKSSSQDGKSSSTAGMKNDFPIEKLQLSSPQADVDLPVNWNRKDSYRRDLEQYIRDNSTHSNQWTDPLEEDRRSRTEQWVESISPGGDEHDSGENKQEDEIEIENCSHHISSNGSSQSVSGSTSAKGDNAELIEILAVQPHIEADVELIWNEHPTSNKDALEDVKISLNGEPVEDKTLKSPEAIPTQPAAMKLLKNPVVVRISSQDTDDQPPSETSLVSSTMDNVSLVKQRYRSTLDQAIAHNGDKVDLDNVERFWTYQYSPDRKEEKEEKGLLAMDRRRSHTPTVERVVLYYTSDKRPSIATLSPSPIPSVYSSSSVSDAFKLFERKSGRSSPSLRKELSHPSLESDDLNISHEQEALHEELTIEVPVIHTRKTSKDDFFRLDDNSESEVEDEGGKVVLPTGKSSPSHLFRSPHPKLRVSRGTSTEDLSGSSEGRAVHVVDDRGHFATKQPSEAHSPNMEHEHNTEIAIVLSDVDSSSMEDLLVLDQRPSSSSPMKSVHFAKQIDADIDSLPKHQYLGTRSISPKPILKRADRKTEELRKVMEKAADSMYKDLKMLVEERDRAIHAIELLPPENPELSNQTALFQTNYRDRLLENKGVLDAKIDHFWKKLKEMPLNEYQSAFVYEVADSKKLTLNVRRRIIPARYLGNHMNIQVERRTKTNLEMASDYARKLAEMRKEMIRRDSDIVQEDEKTVEDILKRVSKSLANLKA